MNAAPLFRNATGTPIDRRFLVSLDGVIQPDSGPSAGAARSAVGPADSAAAGAATPGGAGGAGAGGASKKRKLFKAFKPPSRRAPPPTSPPDDAWGPAPGRMGQRRDGEPNGEGRFSSCVGGDGHGMLPGTSYTGFGHVESLWGDDDDHNDNDGDSHDERRDRGGNRARPSREAVECSAGWGMGAGAGYPGPHEGSDGCSSRGAGTFPRSVQSSPAAASALNTSGWMSGQEDRRRAGGHHVGSGPTPRSADCIDRDFPDRQDIQDIHRFGDPAHRGHGPDDPSSYLESLRTGGGDEGAEAWPGPAADGSGQRGGAHGVGGAGDHQGGHYYCGHHLQHGRDGSFAQGAEPRNERSAVSQRGGGAGAPEATCREPAGRDDHDSGGMTGAGDGSEMRSTQDILSLFGGLEEDGEDHGSPGPGGAGTADTPLRQSRGPNNSPAARPEAARGAVLPVGGGGARRAADMRRAQKEARAAAGEAGAVVAVGGAASAGPADAGIEPVASAADGAAPSADWTCEVCGVRGGASAAFCRVCGAARQGPADEGVLGQSGGGGDDHQGAVDDFSGQHGWDGADFRGGEDWQEREWEGVAGDGNADDGGGGHDDFGGDRVEGMVSREEHDVAEVGHPSSPSRSPSSRIRDREDGTEGAACSSGNVPRAPSKQRMQIDVGSSSESDGA